MTELVFRNDPYLTACEARVVAVHADAVELDRTLFYPMAGGQPGDTGRIGSFRVLDTRKGEAPDQVLHIMEPGVDLRAESFVRISIDWERRYCHMRFHTALHLLGAVVKAPVTGGRMAQDKAHLDFDTEMERLVKRNWRRASTNWSRPGTKRGRTGSGDAELDARPQLVKVARLRSEGRRNKRVTLVLP